MTTLSTFFSTLALVSNPNPNPKTKLVRIRLWKSLSSLILCLGWWVPIYYSHSVHPISPSTHVKHAVLRNVGSTVAIVSLATVATGSGFPGATQAQADSSSTVSISSDIDPISLLKNKAYTVIGDRNGEDSLQICRVVNGMWQVSGAHGYIPNKDDAVARMTAIAGTRIITITMVALLLTIWISSACTIDRHDVANAKHVSLPLSCPICVNIPN